MAKDTTKDVGMLAKIGKIANNALDAITGVTSVEEHSAEVTELMIEGKLADGKTIMFEDEAQSVGSAVFMMTPEGDKIPLPVGEYELENGKMLVVAEEGKVGGGEEVAEEAPVEGEAEVMEDEAPAEEMAEPMEGEEVMEESEMEEAPMEEAAPTELEAGVAQITDEAIAQMVEAAVMKKLQSLGIIPGAEEEEELTYQTADVPEEMSKESEAVEEFTHSPTKSTTKSNDTSWKPKNNIGQRGSIQEILRG